jgi:hypothetical protein
MLRRVAMISLLFMRRMSRGEWYVFRSYLAANVAA